MPEDFIPPTDQPPIPLPPKAESFIKAYQKGKVLEKAGKEKADKAATKLKALLGTSEQGLCGSYKVSWKTVETTRLDLEMLRTDYPKICANYEQKTSYRRFTITNNGK
jgi:predicted phage-related endonuclease